MDRWPTFAALNPPPVRDMPILVGGGGEKVTLRITAQHADIWNGFGDPDVAAHKCRVLDEWCRKVGRDPSEIERSIGGMSTNRLPQLDDYLEAGITHFIMGVGGPDWDLGLLPRLLAWRDAQNG